MFLLQPWPCYAIFDPQGPGSGFKEFSLPDLDPDLSFSFENSGFGSDFSLVMPSSIPWGSGFGFKDFALPELDPDLSFSFEISGFGSDFSLVMPSSIPRAQDPIQGIFPAGS